MRGKGLFGVAFNSVHRITPAYAGKSMICPNGELVVEDHPRLCGEKLPSSYVLGKYGRITPAYAGKSVS